MASNHLFLNYMIEAFTYPIANISNVLTLFWLSANLHTNEDGTLDEDGTG